MRGGLSKSFCGADSWDPSARFLEAPELRLQIPELEVERGEEAAAFLGLPRGLLDTLRS